MDTQQHLWQSILHFNAMLLNGYANIKGGYVFEVFENRNRHCHSITPFLKATSGLQGKKLVGVSHLQLYGIIGRQRSKHYALAALFSPLQVSIRTEQAQGQLGIRPRATTLKDNIFWCGTEAQTQYLQHSRREQTTVIMFVTQHYISSQIWVSVMN